MKALFLLVSQFAVRSQHDLEVAGKVFFAEQFGDMPDPFALLAGNLQKRRLFASDFGDGGIAEKADQLAREVGGAVSFADEMVDLAQDLIAFGFGNGLHDLLEDVRRSGADEVAHRIGSELAGGGCDGLVEDRKSVAHGAITSFGKQG